MRHLSGQQKQSSVNLRGGRMSVRSDSGDEKSTGVQALLRNVPLAPEKKTLRKLEELRALDAPAPALQARAFEILKLDRGLSRKPTEERLQELSARLVDEATRRRSAAEVLGEALRGKPGAERPG